MVSGENNEDFNIPIDGLFINNWMQYWKKDNPNEKPEKCFNEKC